MKQKTKIYLLPAFLAVLFCSSAAFISVAAFTPPPGGCSLDTIWNPVSGTCVPRDTSANPANNPSNITRQNAASVPCPEGLVEENGLCLPADQRFGTGIAGSQSLTDLLLAVIKMLLLLAGVIAVLILVVGGYWYLGSAGSEETAEKGKKAITNAIIGLVVIILSYAIVTILSNTLTSSRFGN